MRAHARPNTGSGAAFSADHAVRFEVARICDLELVLDDLARHRHHLERETRRVGLAGANLRTQLLVEFARRAPARRRWCEDAASRAQQRRERSTSARNSGSPISISRATIRITFATTRDLKLLLPLRDAARFRARRNPPPLAAARWRLAGPAYERLPRLLDEIQQFQFVFDRAPPDARQLDELTRPSIWVRAWLIVMIPH